jgi:hypothetical protein
MSLGMKCRCIVGRGRRLARFCADFDVHGGTSVAWRMDAQEPTCVYKKWQISP